MTAPAPEPDWVDDVLSFWFDELGRKAWFVKDATVDAKIRGRFLPLIEQLAAQPVDAAVTSADRALATVIVLDQFTRNVFRGTARAFATDALALGIAKAAIERGLDQQISRRPARVPLFAVRAQRGPRRSRALGGVDGGARR